MTLSCERTLVPRIAVAGHLCLDLAPRLTAWTEVTPGTLTEVGPLSFSLGGSVANTGSCLLALGAQVVPIANIGDDVLGELVRAMLTDLGFSVAGVSVREQTSTSYSLVIETPLSDRAFWHHIGANGQFDGSSAIPEGLDVFHLGYPPLLPALLVGDGAPLKSLLARARATGAVTSIDLAVVDPVSTSATLDWPAILSAVAPEADIVSPSLDDLTSALRIDEGFSIGLVDRLANGLLDEGAAVVAISAGPRGLFLRTADRRRLESAGGALATIASEWADARLHATPIELASPITTNGAGDAMSAGLAFAVASGTSIEEAAVIANACSAAIMSGEAPTPAVLVRLAPTLAPLFDLELA